MPTCRNCKTRYECDFSRRITWCYECEAKGGSLVLASMQEQIKALSDESGAYMSLVWADDNLRARWQTLVDVYFDINYTFAPSLKHQKLRGFELRLQATIKQGGVFGQLCGVWWAQIQRQYDHDELQWELVKWEDSDAN